METPPSSPEAVTSPAPASPTNPADHAAPAGLAFWLSAAVGAGIVAYALNGLLEHEPRGAPSALRWFVGGALVLDLVVVPLGAILGVVAKRVVPAWIWPVVRAALLVSVVLGAFAWPLVANKGGQPANPTVRPRDYGEGLALALASTWVVAGAVAAAVVVRRRRA